MAEIPYNLTAQEAYDASFLVEAAVQHRDLEVDNPVKAEMALYGYRKWFMAASNSSGTRFDKLWGFISGAAEKTYA